MIEPAQILLVSSAVDGIAVSKKPTPPKESKKKKKRGKGPARRLRQLMRKLDDPVARPARYLREDYPTDSFLVSVSSVDFRRTAEQLEEDMKNGKIEYYPRNPRKLKQQLKGASSTVTPTETGFPTSYDADSLLTNSLGSGGQPSFKFGGMFTAQETKVSNSATKRGGKHDCQESRTTVEAPTGSKAVEEKYFRLQLLNTPDALGNKPAPPREKGRVAEHPSRSMLPPPQSFAKTRLEKEVLAKFERVAQAVAQAEVSRKQYLEEEASKVKISSGENRGASRRLQRQYKEDIMKMKGAEVGVRSSNKAMKCKKRQKDESREQDSRNIEKMRSEKAPVLSGEKKLEDDMKKREEFKRKREEVAALRAQRLQTCKDMVTSFIPEKQTDQRRLAKQWLKAIFAALATESLQLRREKITKKVVAQYKYKFCLRKTEDMIRIASRRRRGILDSQNRFTITVWLTLKVRKWKKQLAEQKFDGAADQVVRFLVDCDEVKGAFTRMMMDYRKKIIRCQRFFRSFLIVRRIRFRTLSTLWQLKERDAIKEHNDGIKDGTLPSYLSVRHPMPRDERDRRVRGLLELATAKHRHDREKYFKSLANRESLYEEACIRDVRALMESEDPSKLPVLVIDETFRRPPLFFVYTYLGQEIDASLKIFWAKKDETARQMQRFHDELLMNKADGVLKNYKKEKITFAKFRIDVEKTIDRGTFGRFDIGTEQRDDEENEAEERLREK